MSIASEARYWLITSHDLVILIVINRESRVFREVSVNRNCTAGKGGMKIINDSSSSYGHSRIESRCGAHRCSRNTSINPTDAS